MKIGYGRMGVAAVLSLSCFAFPAALQQKPAAPTFAGKYTELQDQQKRLVDDWFQRFSETIKKPVAAREGYDMLPLSVKTTFNAVTHALLRTPMTDSSGKVLEESAIRIIDKVDGVAGKVPGAGGDEQFRIYTQLKPGSLELLRRSREFKRGPDNTVYHKGYPICYRSTGGTPSIQVSLTRDATRADIDVDYRSSKFPVFLINGHLNSSNSDVRAGNNDERHNGQWSGLQNWWRNLLGLPLLETVQSKGGEVDEETIPREPKVKANAKPEVAVHDFLNSWLVERKANEAVAYFAEQAFACIEVERGEQIDRGMAKFGMLKGLQEIGQQIGEISNLSEAVQGVRLTGPRGKVIEQPYHAQFVLYDVREDLATQFDCTAKLDPGSASAKALRSQAFGKYYGALFHLKAGKETGQTVATIWAKEAGYWKLVSYDVDPEPENYRIPNLVTPPPVPATVTVKGDPQLIQAANDFLQKWFVRGQVDQAFAYLSAPCYPCLNLYRSEDTPAPQNLEEAGRMIREGMQKLAQTAGSVRRLEEAIAAPVPSHPDIRIVQHAGAKAYVIASIPDYMGEGADCSKRAPGEEPTFTEPQNKVYGNYYAVGFRLTATPEDAGVLWTVWLKEAAGWKIVSYLLLTP